MALSRTWKEALRLVSSIQLRMESIKTNNFQLKCKEAFQVYMITRTKEELVARQLEILRHLADGELLLGWMKIFIPLQFS